MLSETSSDLQVYADNLWRNTEEQPRTGKDTETFIAS